MEASILLLQKHLNHLWRYSGIHIKFYFFRIPCFAPDNHIDKQTCMHWHNLRKVPIHAKTISKISLAVTIEIPVGQVITNTNIIKWKYFNTSNEHKDDLNYRPYSWPLILFCSRHFGGQMWGVGHDNMNDEIICVIRNGISREPISYCTKIRPWGLMGIGTYFSSTSCVL